MKSYKQLILSSFVLLLLFFGSATAQTCYDPRYGYYDCYQSYNYYPDVTQALIEGALIGIVLGGFNNYGGYERNHWDGGHWGGHQGGGWHHGEGHHH